MGWLKKNIDTLFILVALIALFMFLRARSENFQSNNQIESKNLGFFTVSKICVEKEWTECLDLPAAELVKVYVVPDSNGDILIVEPQH